jgi:hypothetical protein
MFYRAERTEKSRKMRLFQIRILVIFRDGDSIYSRKMSLGQPGHPLEAFPDWRCGHFGRSWTNGLTDFLKDFVLKNISLPLWDVERCETDDTVIGRSGPLDDDDRYIALSGAFGSNLFRFHVTYSN